MRKIIHIDMDCFYAAVEMRDFPELQDIPLAIGGSREQRGVISTANYVARRFGVHSAMSTAHALKLCPHLVLKPGRMWLYKEVSQQILQIFQRYTTYIEPLSLDEAYLDVTNCEQCHGSATLIAHQIRQAIAQELNLTASAGVAPLKFLAKIASSINKPNGLQVIPPQEVEEFVLSLPLSKISGVGRVTAARLSELGLVCCADVRHYDLARLLRQFGKMGHILWERSHGRDDREVMPYRLRKSIGVERTIANDIYYWEECELLLDELYQELDRRLSQISLKRSIVRQGVKVKFHDFQQTTQEHLCHQLNRQNLHHLARQVWEHRRAERGVRLLGLHVMLADPQMAKQLVLDIGEYNDLQPTHY